MNKILVSLMFGLLAAGCASHEPVRVSRTSSQSSFETCDGHTATQTEDIEGPRDLVRQAMGGPAVVDVMSGRAVYAPTPYYGGTYYVGSESGYSSHRTRLRGPEQYFRPVTVQGVRGYRYTPRRR